MGQVPSTAALHPAAKPFTCLPKRAIVKIWDEFSVHGNGWSLDQVDFAALLASTSGFAQSATEATQTDFFALLDTDKNELVDALEAIVTLALLSGMDTVEKLQCIFNCYDFEGSRIITQPAALLLLKSAVHGISKVCEAASPRHADVAAAAAVICTHQEGTPAQLAVDDFIVRCVDHPLFNAWLRFCAALVGGGHSTFSGRLIRDRRPCNMSAVETADDNYSQEELESMPWQETAALVPKAENTDARPPKFVPDSYLELQHVFGYTGDQTRNNTHYLANGSLLYTCGRYALTLTLPQEEGIPRQQQRFTIHKSTIAAFAVSHDLAMVATADSGASPMLCIWEPTQMKLLHVVCSGLSGPVRVLNFSAGGLLLLVMYDNWDGGSNIALYNLHDSAWEFRTRCEERCHDACFSGTTSLFAACSSTGLHTWAKRKTSQATTVVYDYAPGVFGSIARDGNPISLHKICRTTAEDQFVSGTATGEIILWENRIATRSVPAHDGCLSTLRYCASNKVVLSGGASDGQVKIWDEALECICVLALSQINADDAGEVTSVCLNADMSTALVGTSNCAAYEFWVRPKSTEEGIKAGAPKSNTPLLVGHGAGETWGLAVSPTADEIITTGDDFAVRLWDTANHIMKATTSFDTKVRVATFAPDGTKIAIGMGSSTGIGKQPKDGAVTILDAASFTTLHATQDATEYITDLKFSPDGSILVAGSADTLIYVYDAATWELKGTLTGHSGCVWHLDFSKDGKYLRSNSEALDLLFWSVTTLQAATAEELQQEPIEWATHNCTLEPDTIGAWTGVGHSSRLHAIDRAPGAPFLVSARTDGRIGIHHFPCQSIDAPFSVMKAHLGDVSALCFNTAGTVLVTMGAQDKLILVWKVVLHEFPVDEADDQDAAVAEPEAEENDEVGDDGAAPPAVPQPEIPVHEICESLKPIQAAKHNDAGYESVQKLMTELPSPEVVPPHGAATSDLEISWIHGFNPYCGGRALSYLPDGSFCYPTGSTLIHYDKSSHKQQYFRHDGKITAVAQLDAEGVVVCCSAAVDDGSVVPLTIWHLATRRRAATLYCPPGTRAVSAVAFSSDGELIAAACRDDNHTIHIFSRKHQRLIASASSTPTNTLCFAKSTAPVIADKEAGEAEPEADSAASSHSYTLLSGGVGSFAVWKIQHDSMVRERGTFAGQTRAANVLCAISLPTDDSSTTRFLIGLESGAVCVVEGRQVTQAQKLGNRPICSMAFVVPESTNGEPSVPIIITAGMDGHIKALSSEDMTVINTFDLRKTLSTVVHSGVKHLDVSRDGRKLLVGTAGGDIVEVFVNDARDVNEGPLVSAHAHGKLNGLAIHPVKSAYATVGDDCMLHIWNSETHRHASQLLLPGPGRSVAYSPNGHLIAVGLGLSAAEEYASILIVSHVQDELRIVHEAKDPRSSVADVKFNPEGTVLAAGAEDNAIYLYDALHNFKLRSQLDRHGAPVCHLDFSVDGMHLLSQDDLGQLILWTLEEDESIDIGAGKIIAETAWATRSCTLGWDTVGVFPAGVTSTFVTTMCRSPDHRLLITGDLEGAVKAFTYPARQYGHPGRTYRLHTREKVHQVSIGHDGVTVVSVGNDRSIVQWRLSSQEATQASEKSEDGNGADDQLSITNDATPQRHATAAANTEFDRLILGAQRTDVLGQLAAVVGGDAAEVGVPSDAQFELRLRAVAGAAIASDSPPSYDLECNALLMAGNLCAALDPERQLRRASLLWSGLVTASTGSNHGHCVAASREGTLNRLQLWESASSSRSSCLEIVAPAAFVQLGFSTDGTLLFGRCGDPENTVYIWRANDRDWTDPHLICEFTSHFGTVHTSALLSHFSTVVVQAECAFVTCSPVVEGLLSFWYTRNGVTSGQICSVSGQENLYECVSLAELPNGKVVAGAEAGNLVVFTGRALTSVQATPHDTAISAMCATSTGQLVTASQNLIVVWSQELQQLKAHSTTELHPAPTAGASPITAFVDSTGYRLLLGFDSSHLYELPLDFSRFALLNVGHIGKTTACSCHPNNSNFFVTADTAGQLFLWDISHRKIAQQVELHGAVTSMQWSPSGKLLAVGAVPASELEDPFLVVFRLADFELEVVCKVPNVTKQWISGMRFTNDEKMLYLTTWAGKLLFCDTEKWEISAITHDIEKPLHPNGLAVSLDDKYFRLAVMDENQNVSFEFLTFQENEFMPMTESGIRVVGVDWGSQSSVADASLSALTRLPGFAPFSTCVNKERGIAAVGDQQGNVKIAKWPAETADEAVVSIQAHKAGGCHVSFSCDGRYLCTAGVSDGAVMMWEVTQNSL